MTSLILGVGVVGLTNMYTSSARGVGKTRQHETATQLALQRIERFSTTPVELLPACGGLVGCRADPHTLEAELAPADSFDCTQYVNDMTSAEPNGAAGAYRVDTVVAPHPSATQGSDARLITVSVCWVDAAGLVQQVMTQRLVVGE